MNWFPMARFPDLTADEIALLVEILSRTNRAKDPFTAETPTGPVVLQNRKAWLSQIGTANRFGWTRRRVRWVLERLCSSGLIRVETQPVVVSPKAETQEADRGHGQGSRPGGHGQGVTIITIEGAWISTVASENSDRGQRPGVAARGRGQLFEIPSVETRRVETPSVSLPLFEEAPVSVPSEPHPPRGSGGTHFDLAWKAWLRVKRKTDQRAEAKLAFDRAAKRVATARKSGDGKAGLWLRDRILAGVEAVVSLGGKGEVPLLATWLNGHRYDFEGDGFTQKILESRSAKAPREDPRDIEWRRRSEERRAELVRREELRRSNGRTA